jgi:hypothetical protein
MDIDGCILDIDARLPYLLVGDFETFDRLHITDKPIAQGIYIYKQFMTDPRFRCIFVTSRTEKVKHYTIKQLESIFGGLHIELLMRPLDNKESDAELKLNMIASAGISSDQVFIAFDDRPSICEAYRDRGWVAYQTAKGY